MGTLIHKKEVKLMSLAFLVIEKNAKKIVSQQKV